MPESNKTNTSFNYKDHVYMKPLKNSKCICMVNCTLWNDGHLEIQSIGERGCKVELRDLLATLVYDWKKGGTK